MGKITEHAQKRLKERLGVKGTKIEEYIERVYLTGKTPNDFTGGVKKYLKNLELENNKFTEIRVKGNDIYIFGENKCLVTVFTMSRRVQKDR